MNLNYLDVDIIIWVGMLQKHIWNQEGLPKELEDNCSRFK